MPPLEVITQDSPSSTDSSSFTPTTIGNQIVGKTRTIDDDDDDVTSGKGEGDESTGGSGSAKNNKCDTPEALRNTVVNFHGILQKRLKERNFYASRTSALNDRLNSGPHEPPPEQVITIETLQVADMLMEIDDLKGKVKEMKEIVHKSNPSSKDRFELSEENEGEGSRQLRNLQPSFFGSVETSEEINSLRAENKQLREKLIGMQKMVEQLQRSKGDRYDKKAQPLALAEENVREMAEEEAVNERSLVSKRREATKQEQTPGNEANDLPNHQQNETVKSEGTHDVAATFEEEAEEKQETCVEEIMTKQFKVEDVNDAKTNDTGDKLTIGTQSLSESKETRPSSLSPSAEARQKAIKSFQEAKRSLKFTMEETEERHIKEIAMMQLKIASLEDDLKKLQSEQTNERTEEVPVSNDVNKLLSTIQTLEFNNKTLLREKESMRHVREPLDALSRENEELRKRKQKDLIALESAQDENLAMNTKIHALTNEISRLQSEHMDAMIKLSLEKEINGAAKDVDGAMASLETMQFSSLPQTRQPVEIEELLSKIEGLEEVNRKLALQCTENEDTITSLNKIFIRGVAEEARQEAYNSAKQEVQQPFSRLKWAASKFKTTF